MIKLYFPIEPVAKARPRVTRTGHCYTPKKTKEFEGTIRHLAILQMHSKGHRALEGALKVHTQFLLKKPKKTKHDRMPVGRPDVDNLQKSLWDALNGVAWLDDSQICEGHSKKLWAEKAEITIFIEEI